MAVKAVVSHGVCIALACRTFQISESCYRYDSKLSDENAEIADWIEKLTALGVGRTCPLWDGQPT
jgi:putative transposase